MISLHVWSRNLVRRLRRRPIAAASFCKRSSFWVTWPLSSLAIPRLCGVSSRCELGLGELLPFAHSHRNTGHSTQIEFSRTTVAAILAAKARLDPLASSLPCCGRVRVNRAARRGTLRPRHEASAGREGESQPGRTGWVRPFWPRILAIVPTWPE